MLAHLKNQLAQKISEKTQLRDLDILKSLEIPKVYDHGHLSWPVFAYAKSQNKIPQDVGARLQKELSGALTELESVVAVGGFLNFKFKSSALAKTLFDSATQLKLGTSQIGEGKTIIVDYSSPNVAKKMHVGHLRATIIGQAIRNLAQASGFKVIGINHIGDWGTQFGKLAWALQEWGQELGARAWTIDGLLELYVRFHEEAEKNPQIEQHGAETFLRLEQGDEEITKIWKRIVEVSIQDYDRMYQLLKVKHDLIQGESFYNNRLDDVIKRLEDKNLLVTSEGARVVMFDEKDNMPPCLIQKSDGASLYATRDLAALFYRRDVLKGDEFLYVVGADQSLHFKQIFKVLELLGYDWFKNCHHLSFGLYRFKEGKMSTRKGRVVHLEDVIQAAVDYVTETVNEKNPDLVDKDRVIQQIAVGAVIFNDLVNDRVKNVEFDLDRAMSIEGDSGPYVQYTAVRCKSVLRKAQFQWRGGVPEGDWTDSEVKLIFSLLQFQDVVKNSYLHFKPNILAQYLLNVCSDFSHFYHLNRILGEDAAVENRRLHLVDLSRRVLEEGLGLLNIESPEQM